MTPSGVVLWYTLCVVVGFVVGVFVTLFVLGAL